MGNPSVLGDCRSVKGSARVQWEILWPKSLGDFQTLALH